MANIWRHASAWLLAVLVIGILIPVRAHAQIPVVQHAPSIELALREALTWLHPAEVALIGAIVFVEPEQMVHPGACGETWVHNRRITLSREPRCLVWLVDVLLHEVGHLTPDCIALARAWQFQPAEDCAERFRASRRWLWGVRPYVAP